ncbi:hypothetical protein GCM10028778_19960 [Barrientosiimonas marina]
MADISKELNAFTTEAGMVNGKRKIEIVKKQNRKAEINVINAMHHLIPQPPYIRFDNFHRLILSISKFPSYQSKE